MALMTIVRHNAVTAHVVKEAAVVVDTLRTVTTHLAQTRSALAAAQATADTTVV
jgi:hypothetical protein